MKILLVEDEKPMADALAEILRQEHYNVDVSYDGNAAMDLIFCEIYDCIILDIMLPGCSGIDIVKAIRKEKIPASVIMLTAKASVEDRVEGLDSGADDYLTKPFAVKELLARVRALGRRNQAAEADALEAGDLILHGASFILSCRHTGAEVKLSEKEYLIMEGLIANYGHVISRENLFLRAWGSDGNAEYNNVEVYISFIRKKLNFIGSDMEIKSIRNLGYELKELKS